MIHPVSLRWHQRLGCSQTRIGYASPRGSPPRAEVLRQGAIYLRVVAPAYGALGFGFVIAFAAMGAGHVLWTFVASFARIMIAAGGGWLAVSFFGAGMAGLAAMVTVSLAAYAAICSVVMLSDSVWRVKAK